MYLKCLEGRGARKDKVSFSFQILTQEKYPTGTDISKLKLIVIRLINVKHVFSISVNCELGYM